MTIELSDDLNWVTELALVYNGKMETIKIDGQFFTVPSIVAALLSKFHNQATEYEKMMNDYKNLWDGTICNNAVLSVLKENYEASKKMVDEDKARPAQEMVMETYEDLISIFQNKKQ